MKTKTRKKQRRPHFQLEDRGEYVERLRTPEIKAYDADRRRLDYRSAITRTISLLAGAIVTFVVLYTWGAPYGQMISRTDFEGKKVAVFHMVAVVILIAYYRIPVFTMIFRPRVWRISMKAIKENPHVFDFDQEA